MKKNLIQFAKCTAVLALVIIAILSFSSCSKDDDLIGMGEEERLEGTWVSNDGLKEEYRFYNCGNGLYIDYREYKYVFWYTIASSGNIRVKIKMQDSYSDWEEEYWSCKIKGDKLWLNGKLFYKEEEKTY